MTGLEGRLIEKMHAGDPMYVLVFVLSYFTVTTLVLILRGGSRK